MRDTFYCNDETYEAQPKAEQLNLGERWRHQSPPFHRQYTRLTSSFLFAMQGYGYSQYQAHSPHHQRSGELPKLYYKSLDHGTDSGGFNEKKRVFKLNDGINHHKTLQDKAGRSSSPSCDLESECGARQKAGGSPRTKMVVAKAIFSEKIMADASMYTDDTAADSSSTMGGSSSDDDERSNQQQLTARGRSESQGQLNDQDTDLDRSSYFVLSGPNYTYEAVPAFTPDVNRTASNNKKIYGKPVSVGEFQNDEDSSHIYAWLQASLKASKEFHAFCGARCTPNANVPLTSV
ncbi:hypothetical protein PHYSODRAFT_331024 [Phytophthora sojae]|uniref:Uncharacterized protein n=1 Tax=Phytophthora sojae (strain P6497) TaxID=1094619 RepID=G4ZES5_PHYSP|nr:hypothetical protein PHYSODRAFT_331024 [Phytophthora sojae]EGZ16989.1 hypothetical protein PHYSODRAFT_331024 [Phytophthora sojae]|eukprot:XP_009526047.1 hypothetical protein PHYSODRAFT_331024 [Phytophthora sojae]